MCTRTLLRLSNCKNVLPTVTQQQVATYKHNAPIAFRQTQEASQHSRLFNACPRCFASDSTGVMNSSAPKAVPSDKQNDGILKRVLNKVGFKPNSKARLKIASHLLYESVADKINYITFFKDFDLPNTFNSWFLVTELHVWLLLMRSMAEGSESGEDGRFLRNGVVEAMWGDVNTRAKKLGAHNPSRTRQQIEILSEQFQAALIAYDEGIMSDDRLLAGALWRRFFEMNCEDFIKIERLVKYVRKQSVMLDSLQREDFVTKPKVQWIDLDKVHV